MDRYQVLTILAVVFGLAVAGCGGVTDEGVGDVQGGLATEGVAYATQTLASTTTATILPSATVDYVATVAAVQATLDEANRLNVQATQEYEVRVHEQFVMTHQVDGMTATAALTAVPLTATQQAMMNQQIATQQSIVVVQITQTVEAPARLIEMQAAEDMVTYAPLRTGLEFFIMFSVGVCFLFLTVFLMMQAQWQRKKIVVEQKQVGVGAEAVLHQLDVTDVELKDVSDGYAKILRFSVPCSADALTELAQGLLSGHKTFAINSWEGSESENFSRRLIEGVRHFFMLNRFAVSSGGGQIILTELGKKFLLAWLDGMRLPDDYQFENKKGE